MRLLEPFHFSHFTHPWVLLLLLAVLALLVAEVAARAPGVMTISTGESLAAIQSRRAILARWVPAVLRALGLAFLLFALARPLQGLQAHKDRAEVIDIMVCADVSGSMEAVDYVLDNQYVSRLDITKRVLHDFVESRKDNKMDRYGLDRTGLILFGGYAWTQCPLTLDYGVLQREIASAHVDHSDARKQRTAIGSALGLAVKRLMKSEAKSKIVILLTDGMNNAGQLDPATAGQIAKDYGIRVYTIGAGSRGQALIPQQSIFGTTMGVIDAPVDDALLERIAKLTGGRYYRASDTQSLRNAYDEISKLETTEVITGDYYDFQEGFVPYAVVGAIALLGSVFSRRLWFETIP
ncbi:MAG: VWA domain-containing protein [Candidatus Hydrogenedentes bacterium]|nr:VWA domain-containing protein [Candidatus Hydrogenedentota bacterium]